MFSRTGRMLWRLALPALLAAALLAHPQAAAQGFAHGIQLCLYTVLPALFPFFVLCALLTGSAEGAALGIPLRPVARWAGLPGREAPLVLAMSWLGGYAVCARMVAALYRQGRLEGRTAEQLLILGCCSGPGFVIGCIGGLLMGSVRLGVLLYGLQLASNFLAAACLALLPPRSSKALTDAPAAVPGTAVDLPQAIRDGVDSSLQVGGCTVFFCTVSSVLRSFFPLDGYRGAIGDALLEISSGCSSFAALGGRAALLGACACLSLPGLSVFCQIRALLGGSVPLRRFVLSRILHLFWLQVLVRICARWLPGVAAACSTLHGRVVVMNRLAPDAAISCALFLVCALYKGRQTFYNRRSLPR